MSFPNKFLSFDASKVKNIFQIDFSKLKKIFQIQEYFSPWPHKVQQNFLAFQNSMEVIMRNEKTQEDPRTKYSDYPSA